MKTPIQETITSSSSQWELSSRDLGLWLATILAVGIWSLAGSWGRGRLVASEVRVQAVSRNNANRSDVLNSEPAWRLDINSATVTELQMLPGIGATRAKAILQERQRRGAFQSIWDLSEVPGITRGLVQRLEPLLRVAKADR
jgi:competence ComEA-like helix-hairpin-helix protein